MHLYSDLLCIVVHQKRFTIMCVGGGGISPQPPPVCSIHLEDATAATGQRHQCAPTPNTGARREIIEQSSGCASPQHQLQVERRESHRANQSGCSPHTNYSERRESIEPIKCNALTTHQLRERRERHRANQVYALTPHQLQVERRERHRANQVYALTPHQLQVERRERHRANQVSMHSPQTIYRWRESHRAISDALANQPLQVERRGRT